MKNKWPLIILLVLLAIAAYFYLNQSPSTIREEYRDFAIEDTASIDRIFIADYDGNTADLKKIEQGHWTINDKYKARQDGVDLMLKTFNAIAIKEPVAESAFETVVKTLASNSTKVEIYAGGERPIKVYYVGHATKSHHGTNMLLELDGKKSAKPFVTHVPGFYGFLSTRFFTEENKWRHRGIFELNPEDIASIRLAYLETPFRSFEIKSNAEGQYDITDLNGQQKIDEVHTAAVMEYLRRYQSVHFELIADETTDHERDSVLASPPLHTFTVKDKAGNEILLKTYYKPGDGTVNINTGVPYEHNVDRLYAYVNEEDFVLMQWPTLDELLAYYEDFKMSTGVDK